jgi:hypothetical protein
MMLRTSSRASTLLVYSILLHLHFLYHHRCSGFSFSNIRTWERKPFVARRFYGVLSLSNVDAENLPENLKELNPKIDIGFSAWIEAIQKATIRQLQPSDEWKENESLIQVKIMTADDLEKESHIPIPEPEHDFDERLYTIKLPMPIPREMKKTMSQFLFLRPDELVLFQCLGNTDWSILIGNPGISKSWFQYKFILLCYRQDLYQQLMSNEAKEAMLSRASISEGSRESFFELYNKPFIPNLIVRTIAGRKSLLFFVDRPMNVLFIEHTPGKLSEITDGNSTILWEPAGKDSPVEYFDCIARIIATVSPDLRRIHEFQKYARKFYMTCPSELQIRLMGIIFRKYAMEEDSITDEKIHLRIQKYGPFIRNALCWSDFEIKEYKTKRDKEINDVCASDTSLCAAFASPVHIMENERLSLASSTFSHRLARFVVDRDSTICCDTYRQAGYRFSSDEVLKLFNVEIAKLGIEQVMAHLIKVNLDLIGVENSTPAFFERLFQLHSLTGIEWKSRQMPLGKNESESVDWKPFLVKLDRVERAVTEFESMTAGVLYYPADESFPLVDMYYKDENENLICIQATFAKKHAKSMSTYQKFYDKIGISPEISKVNLFYLILPKNINEYTQESNQESRFWTDKKEKVDLKWKKSVVFHALLPPKNFESKFPTSEVP